MDRQWLKSHSSMPMAFVSALIFTFIACGGGADLATQVSGKWTREKDNGPVEIHLTQASSTLVIDGQTYKATIQTVDKGRETVQVKVATEAGKTEVWSIHQVWNNNGSAFTIKLRRNGSTEILVPAGRS